MRADQAVSWSEACTQSTFVRLLVKAVTGCLAVLRPVSPHWGHGLPPKIPARQKLPARELGALRQEHLAEHRTIFFANC